MNTISYSTGKRTPFAGMDSLQSHIFGDQAWVYGYPQELIRGIYCPC